MVPNTNPYYTLLAEGNQPRVGYGATVSGCVVAAHTSCPNAQLSGAMLRGALLNYATLTGASMSGAAVAMANFTYASMAHADLSNTTLTGVSLNEIYAPRLSLKNSNLHLGSIDDSYLPGADLQGLDANFGAVVGSNLSHADLTGANLSDFDFNGDNLTGANLTHANLSNGDFTGSDLTGANLTGVTYCNTLMPDGSVKNPHKGLCPQQSTPPAPGAPVPLPSGSPFYGAINALINGHQVGAGSVVSGCKFQAYTKCPEAKLANSDLQGGFSATPPSTKLISRAATSTSAAWPSRTPTRRTSPVFSSVRRRRSTRPWKARPSTKPRWSSPTWSAPIWPGCRSSGRTDDSVPSPGLICAAPTSPEPT
jgi:uncharacterized protein YjbI with pentapeptide repeats